ncbi:rab-GTPase-TBC domain-domain-containing protein [Clohesyomyces aquaticus]|uniref:Rab-GTPase-TBC domain-domain-containing protein n=1 Tax=Clohesyomyces aquaticus TaxID=1231657 RepID=A0A1Y1ZQI5_9PLEO|nr:rab-GTPase-TBC domain-domain-containing protein [Clohesyomyces aquaticus]
MRTTAEAEKYWHELDEFRSLTELKISVSSHNEPNITNGLRSVCWKVFMLFKSLDRSIWTRRLEETRRSYADLKGYYLKAIQHPDEFDSSVDPLSENEESPWNALRADETLRAEIFQDIERCMPDSVYFRQPATQNMMLDILFVWCKGNKDIGYRQGMHELLAPILWVVERDAVVSSEGVEQSQLVYTLDGEYIEHDAFTLFELVMRTAKGFYAPADPGAASKETLMLARSSRIFERYLPKADPGLAAHLVKLEIVPQIFLLRWIRLLFSREFSLPSTLQVWDSLFAIDSTLELVDHISVAMLLRVRWDLIVADTNEAFSLLLRYPSPEAPPHTFIKDALYLRDHLTPDGGAEIITRYGQKAPEWKEKEKPKNPEPKAMRNSIRIPSPSPSFASSRTRQSMSQSQSATTSPRSLTAQIPPAPAPSSLESLLQSSVKGVLDRGSQWGVGKAIRDAVGEVKKNVEALQSGTLSPPALVTQPPNLVRSGGREYRKPARLTTPTSASRPSLERTQSGNLIKKIEDLEKRNKGLAKMLQSAVAELWEHHRERSEFAAAKERERDAATGKGKEKERSSEKESVENLSLAIAKVQFVQVYLEDSTIPLPPLETDLEDTTSDTLTQAQPERTASAPPTTSSPSSSRPATGTSSSLAPPSISLSTLTPSSASTPSTPPPSTSRPPTFQSTLSLSPRNRPLLSHSSFSWMLGSDPGSTSDASSANQTPPPSAFASASRHEVLKADEKRRLGGKGFLFGEEEGEEGGTFTGAGDVRREGLGTRGGGKGAHGKMKGKVESVDEEVIDLGDMKVRGRGAVG